MAALRMGTTAIATLRGDNTRAPVCVVVKTLCRKTRTYQVADQLGTLQSVPFMWVIQKKIA